MAEKTESPKSFPYFESTIVISRGNHRLTVVFQRLEGPPSPDDYDPMLQFLFALVEYAIATGKAKVADHT